MIYDSMKRLGQYKGLNANLDKAIDAVLSNAISAFNPGKNEVNGSLCWINLNTQALKEANDVYERHMEYIDLQIPLEDGEIISVKNVEDIEWPAFDTETAFTKAPRGTDLHMDQGTFAIFFPGDAHLCGVSKDGKTQVKKLVAKVHI
ncbi:MAG: YhcH/YjgK/YiaL family protein [Clostridia bacterium]|nr:YhcH/YjgK/YiaL family protein [Clostridia bacterium]